MNDRNMISSWALYFITILFVINEFEIWTCRITWRNISSLDYELYGDLLHRSWIKNLWNFSHGYGIYLPTSPTQIDLHIEGYLFPMKQLSHSGFMLRQLKKLNRCQLYLQIHTFYDISNGHGTYFDKIYYDGHQDGFHKSTHSWPAQGYPVTKECQL